MVSLQNTQNPMEIYPTSITAVTNNEPQWEATMGRVIRVRPNIYIFTCEMCHSEHRSIDSFLRHSEAHFQSGPTPYSTQSSASTQVHSNPLPSQQVYTDSQTNEFQFDQSSDSVQNQHSLAEPIEITASLSNDPDDYIEEVFEITDLGYDFDGNYPTVENVVVGLTNGTNDRPKQQANQGQSSCSMCPRKYNQSSSMIRHKRMAHGHILAKLASLHKAYKCLICEKKFPKNLKTEAERHMKTHFKGDAKK